MKAQFYLGVGLGAAGGAAAAMLLKPREKDMKKAMDSARQTLDKAVRKFS